MKIVRQISIAGSIALVVLSVSYFTSLFAQDEPPLPPQATSVEPEEVRPVPDDAMEVQTRGPIHEGFATPLTNDVPESIKVREKPPESIEEVPPEIKPEGSNVVWMPGYWSWNDEDEKFLWISGFWRDVPPGRVWVSGYWTEADGGHQWVPGFWSNAKQKEVAYLPPPPESIEEGPSVEAPSQDHFWVPGHWQWQDSRYAWRSRLLGPSNAAELDLDSGTLCLVPERIHFCRWLLRPRNRRARNVVCAGVFQSSRVEPSLITTRRRLPGARTFLTNHFWVRPHTITITTATTTPIVISIGGSGRGTCRLRSDA